MPFCRDCIRRVEGWGREEGTCELCLLDKECFFFFLKEGFLNDRVCPPYKVCICRCVSQRSCYLINSIDVELCFFFHYDYENQRKFRHTPSLTELPTNQQTDIRVHKEDTLPMNEINK